MDEKKARQRAERRDFLKSAAVVGGATGVLVATDSVATEAVGLENELVTERDRGYARTEHVETYYRNARF